MLQAITGSVMRKQTYSQLSSLRVEEFLAHNALHIANRNFASMCNSVGISMIRSQKMPQGIEQYRLALQFLGFSFTGGRVAFNLGLGYLKWGKYHEALEWWFPSTISNQASVEEDRQLHARNAAERCGGIRSKHGENGPD